MQLQSLLSESQLGNDNCVHVLFVLLKLVFVALPSETVWVDLSSPSVVSGVAY